MGTVATPGITSDSLAEDGPLQWNYRAMERYDKQFYTGAIVELQQLPIDRDNQRLPVADDVAPRPPTGLCWPQSHRHLHCLPPGGATPPVLLHRGVTCTRRSPAISRRHASGPYSVSTWYVCTHLLPLYLQSFCQLHHTTCIAHRVLIGCYSTHD